MNMKEIKELLEFGFINIDKPTGPTSFSVGQFVKEKLNLRKTSHLGTLDPAVTGVLPIALNRACKLNEVFMHRNKTYVGIMRLHSEIEKQKLQNEIENFIGKIKQFPPKRSRVKRQEREREIQTFKILEIEGKDVLFETEVQAGTYIRKLIHDLGEGIGGAHMLELRRIKAGLFEEPCVSLYEFEKAVQEFEKGNEKILRMMIIDAEERIRESLPCYEIKEKVVKQALTGKPLMEQDFVKGLDLNEGERFAVFFRDRFIEIAKKVNEGEIISRPEFVYN